MVLLIMTYGEFSEITLNTLKETSPIHHILVKIGLVKIIYRGHDINSIVVDDDEIRNRIICKLSPNEKMLDIISYIESGYLSHSSYQNGLIPKSLNIFKIYKYVFKGYLKLSDGNVVISCAFAATSCVVQFLPWYSERNLFIVICQTMINIAQSTIRKTDKIFV